MIKITDVYFIDVDPFCYIAKHDTQERDKKGARIIKTIGFYSSVREAVKGILNYDIKEDIKSKDVTLYEWVKETQRVNTELEKILAKIPDDKKEEQNEHSAKKEKPTTATKGRKSRQKNI